MARESIAPLSLFTHTPPIGGGGGDAAHVNGQISSSRLELVKPVGAVKQAGSSCAKVIAHVAPTPHEPVAPTADSHVRPKQGSDASTGAAGSDRARPIDLASETRAPLCQWSGTAGEETASACPRAHKSSKPRPRVLRGGAEFALAGFEGRRRCIAVVCAGQAASAVTMGGDDGRTGFRPCGSLLFNYPQKGRDAPR